MKRLLFISWIFLLSVSFGLTKMKADVRMPLIFGDHMVLQQDTKIAIFGWADAGETVEVVFAGQKVKTTADTDGTWRVNLKPIKTKKEGQTLTIAGKNKLVYLDVLVGDVWVASGQSNMEWGMKVRKEYADDIAASEDPLLRLFFVPKNTSLEPLTDIEVPQGTSNPERAARWVLCTPEMLAKINGQGFSATAYYFARDMRAANGRPLGVIQSAWGGTRAEAWTSLSGLKQEPALAHYVAAYEKNVKDNPEILATYPQKQKEFDEAVREWDKTVGKEWNQAQKEWAIAVQAAQAAGKPAPPKPQPRVPRPPNPRKPNGGNNGPSNLFNAMISPLIPLSIKGVIWYQGESNSADPALYKKLFPAMVAQWREFFHNPAMPVYYVQITPWQAEGKDRLDRAWFRQCQLELMQEVPNVGMVTTTDAGSEKFIHPPYKIKVGQRLAYWALAKTYGKEGFLYAGPLYKSHQLKENVVEITFEHGSDGLIPENQKLRGFELVDEKGNIVPAEAEIINGSARVKVWNDSVPHPVEVRYCFRNYMEGDLFNNAEIPASPFRVVIH